MQLVVPSAVSARVMSNASIKTVTPFAKNPLLGYVTETGASESTYYCDYHYQADGGTVLRCGGNWSNGGVAGLWHWAGGLDSSFAYASIGGRLCYKPL